MYGPICEWHLKIQSLTYARAGRKRFQMCLLSAIVVLFSCGPSPVQSSEDGLISTLDTALAVGDLSVTDVRGKGASSGTVLDGNLRNTTAKSIRLDVRLGRALYLANSTASAQNMMATAVYERGGRYYVEDEKPFIEVLPYQTKVVTFNGYCLDFDLENPTERDSLVIQSIPPNLLDITNNILAYERAAGDLEHSTVRAQIALWLAQSHTPEEIRERFPFTAADLAEAYRILAAGF